MVWYNGDGSYSDDANEVEWCSIGVGGDGVRWGEEHLWSTIWVIIVNKMVNLWSIK